MSTEFCCHQKKLPISVTFNKSKTQIIQTFLLYCNNDLKNNLNRILVSQNNEYSS